jgi:hypothetical protein
MSEAEAEQMDSAGLTLQLTLRPKRLAREVAVLCGLCPVLDLPKHSPSASVSPLLIHYLPLQMESEDSILGGHLILTQTYSFFEVEQTRGLSYAGEKVEMSALAV